MPGVSTALGFENTARPRIVPDDRSMVLSTEIHGAAMIEILSSSSLSATNDAAFAPGDFLAAAGETLVAQIRRLIHRELEADRIERDDVGEHRGGARPAGDEVAWRHTRSPMRPATGARNSVKARSSSA